VLHRAVVNLPHRLTNGGAGHYRLAAVRHRTPRMLSQKGMIAVRQRLPIVVVTTVLVVCALVLVILIRGSMNQSGPGTPLVVTPSPGAARTIAAPTGSPPVALDALPTATVQTRYSVDRINGVMIPANPDPSSMVQVARGTAIQVTGWAIDTARNSPAGGVIVSIDNSLNVPATYGLDRSDVATSLGSAALAKVGFSGTVPTDALTPGRHLLVVKILAADGQSYYQPPQAIPITIT
jgi:hypothetical protein